MKKWNIKKEYAKGDDVVRLLLENRGFTTAVDVQTFLNPPKIGDLLIKFTDEFKHSLKQAKVITEIEMQKNSPIIVYGDYDVDGVSATAILYETLKTELGYSNTHYFIPNRFRHGYGLSPGSIDELTIKFGGGLLITVDTGITAVNEIDQARKNGFKVIVTDHHQKPDPLPQADCIVWSDKVVGSTIAWLLSRVLGSKNLYSIALAAVATITDIQPVLGFNRSLLKIGLEILNTNPPLGLQKLFEVAGRKNKRITVYDLGWTIGPRLNASGRLVEAEDSLKLLLEKDENTATDLALKLNTVNSTRQDKTLEMFELAADFVDGQIPKIIFSAKPDYHEGIIGLVAGKLTQQYNRPSVVISVSKEFAKGSVRSVAGVNIIALLREIEHLFENLGGHPMAAGFSIKNENLGELERMLSELAEKHVKDEHLVRVLDIDLAIPLSLVDTNLYHKTQELEPFGLGNEEPVFCSRGVSIVALNSVGRDSTHLSLKLYADGRMYKAIWFGAGEKYASFKMGDMVDVAYTLNLNEYNGCVSVDLMVKDIKKQLK